MKFIVPGRLLFMWDDSKMNFLETFKYNCKRVIVTRYSKILIDYAFCSLSGYCCTFRDESMCAFMLNYSSRWLKSQQSNWTIRRRQKSQVCFSVLLFISFFLEIYLKWFFFRILFSLKLKWFHCFASGRLFCFRSQWK